MGLHVAAEVEVTLLTLFMNSGSRSSKWLQQLQQSFQVSQTAAAIPEQVG